MGAGGGTQEKTLQVNLKRPSCLLNRRGLKAMEQTAVRLGGPAPTPLPESEKHSFSLVLSGFESGQIRT